METITITQQTEPFIPPLQSPVSKILGLASANPRYKICEYLLVVGPDKTVGEELIIKKRDFSATYQNPAAISGKPHITLANFIQSDVVDSVIINRLKTISKHTNRIRVVLKDYQWFHLHTMYINVVYKIDIQQLVRRISAGIKRFAAADSQYPARFILEPHLTICKDLSIEQYEKSRVEYEKKNFSGEFTAKEMVLLKRPILVKNKYEEVGRFEFGGPEILTTILQGNLFQ